MFLPRAEIEPDRVHIRECPEGVALSHFIVLLVWNNIRPLSGARGIGTLQVLQVRDR
jgi:hypothetical protein